MALPSSALAQGLSISLNKTADRETYSTVGEVVTYTYVITNTSPETTFNGGVDLTDDKEPQLVINCPGLSDPLGPGDVLTCTGTYTVTQADIDTGSITNVATAVGLILDGNLLDPFAPATRFAGRDTRKRSLIESVLYHLNPIGTAHAQAAPPPTATDADTITYRPPEAGNEESFDPRPQTKAVTKRFLGHRLGALLDDEPDRPRFVRRYPGALWDGASIGGTPFDVTPTDGGGVSFSGSLSQLARSLGNPSLNNGFDIWTEGHFTSFNDKGGADGDVDVLYVGADYALAENWIVGVLGQFDWAEVSTSADRSKASGDGWMVGPYVSGRLDQNLFFDWRAAWGSSDNSVSPFGTYQDNFDTDRWLTTARLTGNWTSGAWRLTPSLTVKYGEEDQQAYTDSNGIRITGQTVSLGKIEFGPEFGYLWVLPNGTLIEPQLSLVGVWNYQDGGDFFVNGVAVDQGDFTGRLEGGMGVLLPNGWSARGWAGYDGIGTDYDAWSGKVWLNLPLNR